jgi:hypothetical protein
VPSLHAHLQMSATQSPSSSATYFPIGVVRARREGLVGFGQARLHVLHTCVAHMGHGRKREPVVS